MITKKILSITAIIAGINTIVVDGNCSDFNVNSVSDYSYCLSKQSNICNSAQVSVYKKPIISNSIISSGIKFGKTLQNNDAKIYVKKNIKKNNNKEIHNNGLINNGNYEIDIDPELPYNCISNVNNRDNNINENNEDSSSSYNKITNRLRDAIRKTNNINSKHPYNIVLNRNNRINTNDSNKEISSINKLSENEQSEKEYSDSIYKRIDEYRKKKNEEQAEYFHVIPMHNNDKQLIPIIQNNIIECKNDFNSNYENAQNTTFDDVREISVHEIKFDNNRLFQNAQLDNVNNDEQNKFHEGNSCFVYYTNTIKQGPTIMKFWERQNSKLLLSSINQNINSERFANPPTHFVLNNRQSNISYRQVHDTISNMNSGQELNIQQQEQFGLGASSEHNNGNVNNLLNQFNNHHGAVIAGLLGLNNNSRANASDGENISNNRNIGSNGGSNYMRDGIMENIGKIKVGNVVVARNIDICSIY